jgi:hypothetical protein
MRSADLGWKSLVAAVSFFALTVGAQDPAARSSCR